MKYALVLLVAIPLILGCGHPDGKNPVGVLGGGANGYGSFGTSLSSDLSPRQILGAWHQNLSDGVYNVVTFRDNGIVKVDFYNGDQHQSQNGSYFISGDRLDINVSGWQTGSGTVTVNGNTLTVVFDSGTITLQK